MKKIILCFFTVALLLLSTAAVISARTITVNDFNDVIKGDWFYGPVSYVVEDGLFYGTELTKFSPDVAVTRAMFVTVLGRFNETIQTEKFQPKGGISFTDVDDGAYYAKYVAWADKNHLVNGIGNHQFGPNLAISREDMAVLLYRYAEYIKIDTGYTETAYAGFLDTNSISPYAVEPLKWCTSQSLINGYQNRIQPLDTVTRSQCAQVFYNLSSLFDVEKGLHSIPEAAQIRKIEVRNGTAGTSIRITDTDTITEIIGILHDFRYESITATKPGDGWSYCIDIDPLSDGGNVKSIYFRNDDSLEMNGVTYTASTADYFTALFQIMAGQ